MAINGVEVRAISLSLSGGGRKKSWFSAQCLQFLDFNSSIQVVSAIFLKQSLGAIQLKS